MRILIADDEVKVASFIQHGFQEEGHAVDLAHDGEEADLLISVNDYDLVILDVMMPKINGLVLCKRLRENGIQVPILMLTARDTVEDRIRGLDVGADDYLVKPFAFAELSARARALSRRGKATQMQSTSLTVGTLLLDLKTRKAFREEKEIDLSNKEFSLLQYLVENVNTVVTRTMIAEHVWDIHYDNLTNIIDVYINYLRNKVDSDDYEPKMIHTIRGRGYILKSQ